MAAGALVSEDLGDMRVTKISVCGVTFTADLSGALYWAERRLIVVSDLHLEKGSTSPRAA